MSDRRATLLVTIKRRVVDTKGHVDALAAACAKFGDDFDLDRFRTAWNGGDTELRLQAYAVQGAYENAVNGAVKIAQELAELAGWTPANQEPSVFEALKALKESGVITNATMQKLREAYEDRGHVQHDYVNARAADIHESTAATLEAVPTLLQDVHLYIVQSY